MSVRAAFSRQADYCEDLGSPFMGTLMRLFAERLLPGGPVADRVLGWSGDPTAAGDSVPLRLAGGLHALVLSGDRLSGAYPAATVHEDVLWDAIEDALDRRSADLLAWLESPPQTNEVRRSAVVLPVLLHLTERYGRRIDLIELGASGGLNLRADQFFLRARDRSYGRPDSPVVLSPDWSGPPPPACAPVIGRRVGVDLSPIDPGSAEGRLRLLAYLWPDQTDRIARTDAAIGIARDTPASVAAADAGEWLEEVLMHPPEGHLRLIFHTVAWQYFPATTASRAKAAIEAAGAHATTDEPIAWFGMENAGGRGAALTLRLWPGDLTLNLGEADYHGRWVRWNEAFATLP